MYVTLIHAMAETAIKIITPNNVALTLFMVAAPRTADIIRLDKITSTHAPKIAITDAKGVIISLDADSYSGFSNRGTTGTTA